MNDIMIEKAMNGFVITVHSGEYEKFVFLDFPTMMLWLARYYDTPTEYHPLMPGIDWEKMPWHNPPEANKERTTDQQRFGGDK